MENHIKMDNLGVPLFLETPMYCSNVMMQSLDISSDDANPLKAHDGIYAAWSLPK